MYCSYWKNIALDRQIYLKSWYYIIIIKINVNHFFKQDDMIRLKGKLACAAHTADFCCQSVFNDYVFTGIHL